MRNPVRNKSEEDRLAQSILEAPKQWRENQNLLLNRAMLGVQLISFQQRLRTIVQRYQDDLSLYLQNTLIKPLRGLESDLETLSSNHHDLTEAHIRTVYSIPASIDFAGMHEMFVSDIRTAVEEMPETIRTIPEHAVQRLVGRALDEIEIITVSLRRVIEFIVEMEFLGPLQQDLAFWPPRVQRIYTVSQDVLRLISYQQEENATGDGSSESVETAVPLLKKGLERLRAQLAVLDKDCSELINFISSRLDTTLQQLNPYTITRTEGDLQRYVRGHKSRQIQSRFQEIRQRIAGFLNDAVVSLYYRRTEGVLFARQFQEMDPYVGSASIEGAHLMETLSPAAGVLEALPLYYRQLFLDLPNITQEFWVGAEVQLQRAGDAVERWNRGVRGGLLILGEATAGKTALCQLIAQTHFKREEIFVLNPVAGGSSDPEILEREVKKMLGGSGTIDECFAQLPPRCILIVNDLERWWERSRDGGAAISKIVRWIEQYGARCLFLVNANTHAFRLIDRIAPLADQFLDVLIRTPANARQIKEIIMLRHRSAGQQFILGEQPEDEVSTLAIARLFTSIFDYSRGNVGAALQAWIAAVRRVGQNGMIVEPLELPDMSVVDTISPLQKALLVHLLLHGQMTFHRLQSISELEEAHLRHEILILQRMEWVRENKRGVLSVDRFLLPHLTHAFFERRLI